MASDLPKLQVSKCLRKSGQPGALLRRYPHHQERPWQPLLCRQLQVRGSRHREFWRGLFHCYTCIPGNWHCYTLDLLFVVMLTSLKNQRGLSLFGGPWGYFSTLHTEEICNILLFIIVILQHSKIWSLKTVFTQIQHRPSLLLQIMPTLNR